MIALLQRVSQASVVVSGEQIATIGRGMLGLIAVERGDSLHDVDRLAERLLRFRMFADESGRMNLDVRAAGGALLLVPQFTLAADTDAGHRPSFSGGAPPVEANALFDALAERIVALGQPVATGRFGADMQVALINDGPVTFQLRVRSAN